MAVPQISFFFPIPGLFCHGLGNRLRAIPLIWPFLMMVGELALGPFPRLPSFYLYVGNRPHGHSPYRVSFDMGWGIALGRFLSFDLFP